MSRRWYASGATLTFDQPLTGSVVAVDHRALLIIRYDTRPDGETITAHVRRLHGPKMPNENDWREQGISFRGRVMWSVYDNPDRIPLCSCCQEPWPCSKAESERAAKVELANLAEKISRSDAQCCYSCGEVITTRQSSIIAPEDHVELAGFPAPRFHLRSRCRDRLIHYERKRKALLGDGWLPLLAEGETLP